MYKHILVPYDGSPMSDRAIAESIALAKLAGAKITLVNVVAPYHIPLAGDHSSDPVRAIEHQYLVELEKRAGAMLESVRKRTVDAGVACESVVRSGVHPYEEIIDTAQSSGCDLIVMASHGRRGIRGLLLGSETTKVLTHCSISVLIVR